MPGVARISEEDHRAADSQGNPVPGGGPLPGSPGLPGITGITRRTVTRRTTRRTTIAGRWSCQSRSSSQSQYVIEPDDGDMLHSVTDVYTNDGIKEVFISPAEIVISFVLADCLTLL